MKKDPKHCREVFRKVCSELGRDLDSPECRPIMAHIRRCADCSARLDSMEKTIELFRRYPTPRRRKLRTKSAPGR